MAAMRVILIQAPGFRDSASNEAQMNALAQPAIQHEVPGREKTGFSVEH
jgi:hypothetical protein